MSLKSQHFVSEDKTRYSRKGMSIEEYIEKYGPMPSSEKPFFYDQLKFEKKKNKRLRNIVAFLTVVLLVLSGWLCAINAQKNSAEDSLIYKESVCSQQEVTIKKLQKRLSEITPEYEFYNKNAVIVAAISGERYHKYGCHYIDGHSFYIFNTETAKKKGYSPCFYCYKK